MSYKSYTRENVEGIIRIICVGAAFVLAIHGMSGIQDPTWASAPHYGSSLIALNPLAFIEILIAPLMLGALLYYDIFVLNNTVKEG